MHFQLEGTRLRILKLKIQSERLDWNYPIKINCSINLLF